MFFCDLKRHNRRDGNLPIRKYYEEYNSSSLFYIANLNKTTKEST